MKKIVTYLAIIISTVFSCVSTENKEEKLSIEGWNILSDNERLAEQVIEKAGEYELNHLQLSHHIVMDLRHVKNPDKAALVNRLSEKAHEEGIKEVCIWDHTLYGLDYYPDEFRTGPDNLLNLDNPDLWRWIKDDYREMLELVPGVDGIILTFIETGAHIEDQYSEILTKEEEKLATIVDTLASIIIDEYDKSLYIRTFVYNKAELSSMLNCINLIQHPDIKVMTKEVPHDFFLTHPVAEFVKEIKFPTIIEFDAAHEYNGQGIITSMFPEVHLKRWEYYKNLPNITGYVARTDRFNNTTIINNPAEINLFALHQSFNRKSDIDSIYSQFIEKEYGSAATPYLVPAFKLAYPIISSSFYTLGLNINSHSRLDYLDNSSYQRHVSGKWMDDPIITIKKGINEEFHYWKDIVNHLSLPWYKRKEGTQLAQESPWVLEKNWLKPEELMNETYLRYVLKEKKYGVEKAREALEMVKAAAPFVQNAEKYDTLLHVYERTKLTVRLYESVAKLFFGYRVFARGEEFRTDYVRDILEEGLTDTKSIALEMKKYPWKGPKGQYDWEEDIYRALSYYNAVKTRTSDTYYRGFFPYFPWKGLSEEEREKIWMKAKLEIE